MTDREEYVFEATDENLTGKLRSDPGEPYAVAQEFIAEWAGERLAWRDDFYKYTGSRWAKEEINDVMSEVNRELGASVYERYDKDKKKEIRYKWSPNNTSLSNLKTQLLLQSALHTSVEPVVDKEFIPFENGRYSVSTGVLLPHDPSIFNLHASPVRYDPEAVSPEWDQAIKQYFGGDQNAIDLHYLWMLYELTGDTSLQKGYVLLGETRSGKSTMMDVGTALVGIDQVVPMSINRFEGSFDQAPLIGRSVCRIGDVRDTGGSPAAKRARMMAVESLLGIIGEDLQSVNRKGREHWSGKLGVRFTLCSNVEFGLDDPSGAIIGRFIFNRTIGSHQGSVDPGLKDRIIKNELPGVLNRVLEYTERLYQPWPETEASRDTAKNMRASAMPLLGWMEDCGLAARPEYQIPCKEAFDLYCDWAKENKVRVVDSSQFGVDLRAAVSRLTKAYRGPRGGQVRYYVGLGRPEDVL